MPEPDGDQFRDLWVSQYNPSPKRPVPTEVANEAYRRARNTDRYGNRYGELHEDVRGNIDAVVNRLAAYRWGYYETQQSGLASRLDELVGDTSDLDEEPRPPPEDFGGTQAEWDLLDLEDEMQRDGRIHYPLDERDPLDEWDGVTDENPRGPDYDAPDPFASWQTEVDRTQAEHAEYLSGVEARQAERRAERE